MSERIKADIIEAPANHAVYVSHPDAVAGLIRQAASAIG
jgi:hypothetical protein